MYSPEMTFWLSRRMSRMIQSDSGAEFQQRTLM